MTYVLALVAQATDKDLRLTRKRAAVAAAKHYRGPPAAGRAYLKHKRDRLALSALDRERGAIAASFYKADRERGAKAASFKP